MSSGGVHPITHGGLTNGHLKLHPDLHHLDGRDPGSYAQGQAFPRYTAPGWLPFGMARSTQSLRRGM